MLLDYCLCISLILFNITVQFGERAPPLLEDYEVPHLFKDDFFDLLGHDQRPPFRWLIIGPERSGASWHVDPGLTSAWNTLLCGRKRFTLSLFDPTLTSAMAILFYSCFSYTFLLFYIQIDGHYTPPAGYLLE